ncbi:MAG: hypothetical protein ACRDZR_03200 [Acidimicrobiales bacterium]
MSTQRSASNVWRPDNTSKDLSRRDDVVAMVRDVLRCHGAIATRASTRASPEGSLASVAFGVLMERMGRFPDIKMREICEALDVAVDCGR